MTAHLTPPPSSVVTIRGLAPEVKTRLRLRAAHHGRSMEAEARAILEAALFTSEEDEVDLATFARGLFSEIGGADLARPPHENPRTPRGFEPGSSPKRSPKR